MEKKFNEMSLDEQISYRQKQVSTLKAKKVKAENERFRFIGKRFCQFFQDTPYSEVQIDTFLKCVYHAYEKQYLGK